MRFRLGSPLLLLLTTLLVSPTVRADEPRAVLTDKEAVIVGPAQILAMPAVDSIAVHQEGHYALVARHEGDRLPYRIGETDTGPGILSVPGHSVSIAQWYGREVSIVLWNSRKEKVTTVWRHAPEEGSEVSVWDMEWLPGTANALALVMTVRSGMPDAPLVYDLVFINAAQGSSRTVPLPPTLMQGDPTLRLLVPPSGSPALLSASYRRTQTEGRTVFYRVETNGLSATPVATLEGVVILNAWLADGKTLTGTRIEVGEDQLRKFTPVAYDLTARTLRNLPESPKQTERSPTSDDQAHAAVAALPIRLTRGEARPTPAAEVSAPLPLVYLETATPAAKDALPRDGRTLLAADAVPDRSGAGLLADGSAALYFQHDTLYVAPLRRIDRAAYVAARLAAWQKSITANARQVDSALQQYALDNKGLPPPGSDIRSMLFGPNGYIRSDSCLLDPATGADGFTYTYTGKPDAIGNTPLFVLRGAGGSVTFYASGSPGRGAPEWKPDPPAGGGQ